MFSIFKKQTVAQEGVLRDLSEVQLLEVSGGKSCSSSESSESSSSSGHNNRWNHKHHKHHHKNRRHHYSWCNSYSGRSCNCGGSDS